ncbi:hypothetical protein BDI4_540026 [Burkholderia diffusa]|nr:hypothetical protein BDI4_540026 [Burkholderia diffusa]
MGRVHAAPARDPWPLYVGEPRARRRIRCAAREPDRRDGGVRPDFPRRMVIASLKH